MSSSKPGEQQSLRSMDAGKSTYGQHSEPTPTIPPHEGLIELQQAADAAGESPSVLVTAASDGRWLSDIDLESRIKDQKAATKGWRPVLLLTYTAIGVALGDLGTSPIYTLSAVFSEPPTEDQVLGAASIIFWAIILVVVVKYQCICLMLNDHGEGGTFALYSLLARFIGFVPGLKEGSPHVADFSLGRYSSRARTGTPSSSKRIAKQLRSYIRANRGLQLAMLLLVLLMTGMVIADGVLTPAQSVLGAFGALTIKTSISQSTIAGISMGVLAALFLAQPLGTHHLGLLYSPILITWFVFNIVTGIHNIAVFYPPIFKVINPYYLYVFFRNRQFIAWEQMATIFLALTGAEASYADLGHFTAASIRLAFLGVLTPSVILCYFGQAAWMIKNPQGYATSFFSSIPWGDAFFWTYFVIAVAASCVASQTNITAAFSIVKQSITLNCFPRCTIIHTSKKVAGQMWIPLIAVFLAIFSITSVGIFQNSVAIGYSFGVCVSTMMIGTDFLVTIAMIVVWELPLYVPITFFCLFGFVDGVFWTANLTKIPKGGWYAVLVASIVSGFSYLWFFGTSIKRQVAIQHTTPYDELFQVDDESQQLYDPKKRCSVLRLPVVGMFYTERGDLYAPTALRMFVSRMGAIPNVCVLVTIRQVPVSTVLPEERLLVRKIDEAPGIYHIIARYGYTDRIDQGHDFVKSVLSKVQLVQDYPVDIKQESTLYVTVNANLKVPAHHIAKRLFIEGVYAVVSRMLVARVYEGWNIPPEELVELGVVLEL